MGWADSYISKLQAGEWVSFRPRGNSMTPKIDSGDFVVLCPVTKVEIKKGDIVLCKVAGRQYLHLVKAVQGERYQIGNNHGRINGWTTRDSIYGVLTENRRKDG